MTSPALSPLAALFQQSRMGVRIVRPTEHAVPDTWQPWLLTMYPGYVRHPFAARHEELWEHIWAIDYADAPRPFVAIWARGGGKSTTAELACAALGLRGARRYVLYVRETQEQADNSVTNIATLLERPEVELYYPRHAERAVGKYGSSRGWRRNRLHTAGGFTIDAMGLDTAGRGAKVDEQRPDFIVFDDIDGKHDNASATAKKIATITTSILPAGAENCGVLAIQNLIIADGFFSRMVDGRATYLSRRIVSGPHPAVRRLKAEWKEEPVEDDGPPTRRAVIVQGEATWEGQNLATCQRQIDDWGLEAFEKEAQHDVFERREGVVLAFDPNEHFIDRTIEQLHALVRLGQAFGYIDFGSWRFFFGASACDTQGRAIRVGEVFSQREEIAVRAKRIHDECERLGIVKGDRLAIPRFPIWGDSANPTDMTELNAAWRDGWRDERTGKPVTSPLRVVGVGKGKGMLQAAIERINDKLAAGAILFVRSVGAGHRWQLGYNVGSSGTPMTGSRLIWEIKHWAFPAPMDGTAQKQEPDDNTADGADGMAAFRYGHMSWWRAGKDHDDEEVSAFDAKMLEADAQRSRSIKHRMAKRRTHRPIDPHFGEY
jgi:hypothetical protein